MSFKNWPDNEVAVATGPDTITVDGVATGTTAGLTLRNTTAATIGAQVQRSPTLMLYGTAWDTNDTVSRPAGMGMQLRSVAGTTVSGELEFLTDFASSVTEAGVAIGDGYLRFGVSNLPTTGRVRSAHNTLFYVGTLSGTSTNVNLVSWGTGGQTNGLTFGAAGVAALRFNAVDGATTGLYIDGTEVQYGRALVQFGAAVASPVFGHEDRGASGAVTATRIKSQGTTQASTASGALSLDIGRPGAGGASGVGSLRAVRSDNSTFDTAFSWDSSGSAPRAGFFGTAPVVKGTVTGLKAGNAALGSLLTVLATYGLLTDSSGA